MIDIVECFNEAGIYLQKKIQMGGRSNSYEPPKDK